jgi:pimeloyl-ACP methyl ester carboxylesterase
MMHLLGSPNTVRRSAQHPVRGVNYHVNEWGDPSQPILIMLHGWGDAGSTFQFVVESLKQQWFVVAPDWRGFGESRHQCSSYWFPDYIADLDALLSIYSPDRPSPILGHSMGANIAGLYAGIFPERVSGFINVEGFGLADRGALAAPANYRRWIENGRAPATYTSFESFEELAGRVLLRSPKISPERALFVARQWGRQTADGVVEIKADPAHKLPNAVLYRRAEAEACWGQVVAPVLLVVGADSDFKAGVKSWLDTDSPAVPYPTKSVITVADAGHMIHFEQPDALADISEAFLKTLAA